MENMSRSELQNFIITKEQELDDLRKAIANGEDVPFSKLANLEDEIEDAESELEKLAELERDDNSGSNLENARDREEIKEIEIDNENELEAIRLREEQEKALEETQNQKQEKEEQSQIEGLENIDDSSPKFTLSQWESKTGIDIVPDDYIRQKYSKELTEEEFKQILQNENVPKIIQEPGLADEYLKTSEDWDSVKTSKSAIDQAIRSGNFPMEVNEESYILLEYNKDKIMDEHEDKDDEGYGKIDEEDIYGKEANNSEFEEEIEDPYETKEKDEKEVQDSIIEQVAKEYMKIKGTEATIVMTDQVVQMAMSMGYMNTQNIETVMSQVAPLVASAISQENEEIPKSDFDKISRGMSYDLEHPYQEEENEIEEELTPGMPKKIQ